MAEVAQEASLSEQGGTGQRGGRVRNPPSAAQSPGRFMTPAVLAVSILAAPPSLETGRVGDLSEDQLARGCAMAHRAFSIKAGYCGGSLAKDQRRGGQGVGLENGPAAWAGAVGVRQSIDCSTARNSSMTPGRSASRFFQHCPVLGVQRTVTPVVAVPRCLPDVAARDRVPVQAVCAALPRTRSERCTPLGQGAAPAAGPGPWPAGQPPPGPTVRQSIERCNRGIPLAETRLGPIAV
jgi:hypothetical protein